MQTNSNRFKNLKCNSNRWQCNSNILPLIDSINVSKKHYESVCLNYNEWLERSKFGDREILNKSPDTYYKMYGKLD